MKKLVYSFFYLLLDNHLSTLTIRDIHTIITEIKGSTLTDEMKDELLEYASGKLEQKAKALEQEARQIRTYIQ